MLYMKQSILFGNGINRLSWSGMSWGALLNEIVEENKQLLDSSTINSTHIFDDICYNGKSTSSNVTEIKELFKEKIIEAREGANDETASAYKNLINLHAEHYLTTNYDGYVEKLLEDEFGKPTYRNSGHYISVHRKYIYAKGDKRVSFWPIHGDFNKTETMMLGFSHYCVSISALCHYLTNGSTRLNGYHDGRSSLHNYRKWKEQHHASYIQYKIKEKKINDNPSFWADLFFTTDVHIIGLELDFSEIDIWMVLNRRKQLLKNGNIRNKIFFYGLHGNNWSLLEAYGVDLYSPEFDGNWSDFYNKCIQKMKKNINKRRKQ